MSDKVAASLLTIVLAVSVADAGIRPTWPVEYAAEHAELIIVGERGAAKGNCLEVRVKDVLLGSAAKSGETILVYQLGDYDTIFSADWFKRDRKALELKDRPIMLFLARKAVPENTAPGAFELQTTGYGSAIKILDDQKVYGYYQWMNPGPYRLSLEGCSKQELLERIPRALILAKKWATIKAHADTNKRDEAIVEFLMDPTLPWHFSWEGCRSMKNSGLLVAVIRHELKQAEADAAKRKLSKDELPPKNRAKLPRERLYPDDRHFGWKPLSVVLAWIQDDANELLPHLQQIKEILPEYHSDAIRCAARTCGPAAIPFLRQAILDQDEQDQAASGLGRIGTPEARAALVHALSAHVQKHDGISWGVTQTLAVKWPGAWKEFADTIHRDRGEQIKIKQYLDESWKTLVRHQIVKAEDLPKRYTENYEPIIERLGSATFAIREKATRELKALLRQHHDGAIVRGLLQSTAQAGANPEIRRRAAHLLDAER